MDDLFRTQLTFHFDNSNIFQSHIAYLPICNQGFLIRGLFGALAQVYTYDITMLNIEQPAVTASLLTSDTL